MMIALKSFIAEYDLSAVLAIERGDVQRIVIHEAWQTIRTQYGDVKAVRNIFLYLVLQTALVSYQIAGSGPLRWTEIMQKITTDFGVLSRMLHDRSSTHVWWLATMQNSRYNKRLYNMKAKRLASFFAAYDQFDHDGVCFSAWYEDMESLWLLLSRAMKQSLFAKTIVFAVKMFGYAASAVYDRFVVYPARIPIPLDSRLRTIALAQDDFLGKQKIQDRLLHEYFAQLATDSGLPPLHLDSLLWLRYWEIFHQ